MASTADPSREQAQEPTEAVRSICRSGEPLQLDLGDGAELVAAHASDHALIHELLLAVIQGPSVEEFQASIDDPAYEPRNRLLVKRNGRLISHVHLTNRVLQFGKITLPLSEIQRLTTLPEYRRAGYARRLMTAAETQMRNEGAPVAMLRSNAPQIFAPLGWLPLDLPAYFQVGARELRASLESQMKPRAKKLTTRMWRHVELSSLMELYDQHTAGACGPLLRSEEYWRWLVGRKAYDQILVAIDGHDNLEFGQQGPRIVGYAVLRGERIVELITKDGRKSIARQLLIRACREAIERDIYSLLVYAPPVGPLLSLLQASKAKPDVASCPARERLMVKVLDRHGLLRRLYDEFYDRSKSIGLARPAEFGVEISGKPHRLQFTRRSVHLTQEEVERIDCTCTDQQFDAMLVGQIDLVDECPDSITFRTKAIRETFAALFPRLSIWRPQFDSLQA